MRRAATPLLLALAAAACGGRPPPGAASSDLPLSPGYWEIASAVGLARPVKVLACLDSAEQLSLPALASRIGALACRRGAEDDLRGPRPACVKDVAKLTSDATLHRSKTRFVLDVRSQFRTVRGMPEEVRITAHGRRIGDCPVASA